MTYPPGNDPYSQGQQYPSSGGPYQAPGDPYQGQQYPPPGTDPYSQGQQYAPTSNPPYQQYPAYPPSGMPYSPPPQVVFVPGMGQRPTSGLAVASMVLGIVGFFTSCCTFGVLSLLAVILGHAGLSDTKRNNKGGSGMAVTGLVLGYVLLVPAVLFSIWVIFGAGMTALGGVAGIDTSATPTPS